MLHLLAVRGMNSLSTLSPCRLFLHYINSGSGSILRAYHFMALSGAQHKLSLISLELDHMSWCKMFSGFPTALPQLSVIFVLS